MVSDTQKIQQKRSGFYAWRVLALMLGPRAGGAGVVQFSSTNFVIPLEATLGVNRSVISSIFALGMLVSSITSPALGILIDKFGARKILFATTLLVGGGFMLLSQAHSILVVGIAYIGFVGLGFMTLAFQGTSVIVNNWFDKYKAMAMSILQVGASFGAFILVPLLAYIIDSMGWREAAFVAGVIIIVLGIPGVIFSRNAPEEMGLGPDGVPRDPSLPPSSSIAPELTGLTAMQAARTTVFWTLSFATVFSTAATFTLQIHFIPILVSKGMGPVGAAGLLSILALVSIPVTILTGALGDRFHRPKVAAVLSAVVGLGVLVLTLGTNLWVFWVAIVLISGFQGLFPLVWAATGEAFGRRAFGTIRGAITAVQVLGTATMPVIAGTLFDRTGSYTIALWMVIGCTLLTSLFFLLTPRMTYKTTRMPSGTPEST
jgi:MFS family permease